MNGTNLQSEYVLTVEWDKTWVNLANPNHFHELSLSRIIQELDITANDLSADCLIDMLTRIPGLKFLSAGQINGFNDSVLKAWTESGTARSLTALNLDSSDNISDEALNKFITRYGSQLQSCVLSGMAHITDQLWMSILPILSSAKILVMGTHERLQVNIHVDQLMDAIASNCPKLERLELRWVTRNIYLKFSWLKRRFLFRWDPENLRFSDKSQKAIDLLRVKCLKLRCMVLSDGRYYELVKANFERADRMTVVRNTTCCRVSAYYMLQNYNDLIFNWFAVF